MRATAEKDVSAILSRPRARWHACLQRMRGRATSTLAAHAAGNSTSPGRGILTESDAMQQEGKQEVQGVEVRESKQRRSSSRNDEKDSARDTRGSKTSEDLVKDQPRESKRTETKEERKLRKEREALKAAKKTGEKQESVREGGSKSREERGHKEEDRKEARKEQKGESQLEGGSSKSRAPEAAKQSVAASHSSSVGGSSKHAKEGSRGVKEGKEPKESVREEKGKGKAPMRDEEEEPLGGYEAVSKARKLALHTEISQELPDAKRLQTLLELAVEAECGAVREHLTGRHAAIADMFEEACSQFIVESEGITISKLKRAASRPAVPAKHKPNPVNEAYAREEAQLKKTLERFNAEEQEWHRVRATPVSATPQPTFALLPPAGSMPASSHVLMNELSIADRNLLSNSTGKDSELSELLAWAHGYIHCGLDKPRQALASVEERSENLQQQHSKLIQSTRSAVRAPFASAPANPKELLRALAAS